MCIIFLWGLMYMTIPVNSFVLQIWTEMQNDFLPNFVLCNTTQRFIRSSKVPPHPIQKPTVPYAKPNFYCGSQVRSLFFLLLIYASYIVHLVIYCCLPTSFSVLSSCSNLFLALDPVPPGPWNLCFHLGFTLNRTHGRHVHTIAILMPWKLDQKLGQLFVWCVPDP